MNTSPPCYDRLSFGAASEEGILGLLEWLDFWHFR
jgi:hypothetical protein